MLLGSWRRPLRGMPEALPEPASICNYSIVPILTLSGRGGSLGGMDAEARYATESAGADRPRYTCPRLLSVPSHGAPTASELHTRWRTASGSKSSVAHAGRNASGQSSRSSMIHCHAMAYGLVPRG